LFARETRAVRGPFVDITNDPEGIRFTRFPEYRPLRIRQDEISDEQILEWLMEGEEKREMADPDHLPYDPPKGF